MAAKVIKIEIPIETQDKTDPALGKITAKMDDLDSAAKKARKSMDNASKGASGFEKSLGKSMDNASKKAKGFEQSMGSLLKQNWKILLEAKDKITPTVKQAIIYVKGLTGKAWKVTLKAVDLVTSPVRRVFGLLKSPLVAAGVTISAGAGIASTVKTYAEFEAAMSQVKAVSGATGEEFTELTAKAKQMGATTKFTATQSAEAFNYMAMAGWKASDMMSGIEGIMNLAAASGEDLGTTSDIVTDALTAFGLKASDSTHFADVLAQASASANTNVSKMGQTFQYVAPVAGAMGYSIEDTALAIGLMANAGIKGEKAGTALRSIFTRLSDPPKDAAEAIEKLGLSITNADGSMRPLNNVMQDLRKSFSGLTQEQKVQMASQLAGQEAMSGLLSLVNASEEDYNKLAEAIGNADGASKKMSDTMLDNLSGKWTLFKAALDGVKISLGERFEPYLMEALDWLTEKMPVVEDVLLKGMNSIDDFVDQSKDKIAEFTATDEWKNADLFGKIGIAWDELIAEPFSEWWNSTGKVKMAGFAKDLGTGIGSGISAGIMALFGIDVSSVVDEGSSIGAQFAKGFSEGMQGTNVAGALGKIVMGAFSSAGKLLPGGQAPDISSLLSAAMIAKVAGPLMDLGGGAFKLGKGIYKSAKGGMLAKVIGSASVADELAGVGMMTGTGLAGKFASIGARLGGASIASTGTGLAFAGAGATAGGVVGGAALVSGAMDAYKAVKSNDAEEKKAYGTSAGLKVGGVAAGAAIGTAILPLIGTFIGAGIGGLAGWLGGNKVKKDYEESAAAAELLAEKSKYALEGAKFDTKELGDAFKDTNVTVEEFAGMMQEATANKIRDSFGDIKLSMQEIDEAAKQIAFGDQEQAMTKFANAAADAQNSFANLQGATQTVDKLNWKASLGMEFDENDVSAYMAGIDGMIQGASQYLEDKHYEAKAAIDFLVGPGGDVDMMSGLNAMYTDLQSEVDSLGGDLKAKVSLALEDGKITGDEQKIISELQNKITEITDQINEAETEASFQSLKIKYSGAALDADSFANLLTEVQAKTNEMASSYDEALEISLTNLNLQLKKGAITQEQFNEQFEEITEGYQAKIRDLTVRVESFGLESIADSFGSELDGILPDLEGTVAERLGTAMHNAIASGVDVTEWSSTGDGLASAVKWLGLDGLSAVTQAAVAEMMGQLARALPEQMLSSGVDMSDVFNSIAKTTAENTDVSEAKAVAQGKCKEMYDIPAPEEGVLAFQKWRQDLESGALQAVESADFSPAKTALDQKHREIAPSVESMDVSELTPALQTGISSIPQGLDYSSVTTAVGTGVGNAITASMPSIQSAISTLYSQVGAAINSAFAAGFKTTTTVTITVNYKLANPSATINFSGGGSGTATVSGSIASHANGGFANGPQLTWWGEDGPEVIIPLGSKRRQRGLELWEQAGQMLGVSQHADGGMIGSSATSTSYFDYSSQNAVQSMSEGEKESENVPSSIPKDDSGAREVNLNMNVNPQFIISGDSGKDEDDILKIIRSHMKELADDLGGELADRLNEVFSNMPLKA